MRPQKNNRKNGAQAFRAVKPKALLVMEGDPGDRRYYTDILDVFGYQVQACTVFQEGVLRLEKDVFDFVLVGQGTIHFEGSRVLKRAIEINRSLPVLVVARYLEMGCYQASMQLGAVDYLVEPVTVTMIAQVLAEHPPVQRNQAPATRHSPLLTVLETGI